jgi:hypothetical protein
MVKIKAKVRSNSRSIPRIFNADIDYSGLKLISHDLFIGSLHSGRRIILIFLEKSCL